MTVWDVSGLQESEVAAGPCRLLEWDTAFWGVTVARVTAESMTDESRGVIEDWCIDNGVSCAYFLANGDDPETISAAERGGFFETDARVTLSKVLGPERQDAPRVHTRLAREGDLPALREIARVSHGTTRFYHDPHFPDDRCGELYAEWIQSAYEGPTAVLVVDQGGDAVAYVTCAVEDGNRGYIGLIAVAPELRGRHLGTALGNAALDWIIAAGATHSVVVTQARNVAAVRFIQKSGYLVESTKLWFHKWYDR